MARKAFVGIGDKARKVKKIYAGIASKARWVKKAYVGIGGVARLFWKDYDWPDRVSVTALSVARSALAATTVGSYALFGGGDSSSVVDAYKVIA